MVPAAAESPYPREDMHGVTVTTLALHRLAGVRVPTLNLGIHITF